MLPHHGEPAAVPPGARARALGPRAAPAAVQLHAGDTRVGVLVPRHAHHHVLPRARALHGHGRHGPEGAGDGHLVGGELPGDVVRGAAQRAVTLQVAPDIFCVLSKIFPTSLGRPGSTHSRSLCPAPPTSADPPPA